MTLRTASLILLSIVPGLSLVATPPEPAVVPGPLLTQAPYAATGVVSARVPDGMYLGSGSAVDARVVLTAAHVFFDDDRLGWNSSVWTWQRAARMDNFGSYHEERTARAMRVLAGYASAVQTYSPAQGVSLEEFNRDTLCMVFYDDISGGHVMPLAAGSAGIGGLKMTIGYPVDLPGGERPLGQMSAHGPGGLLASFTRHGGTLDRAGYLNQVYRTQDFTSGPGGSGGPLVSALDGVWQQTGVLVGGASDYSSVLVRQIDEDAVALVAAAKHDAENPGSGGGGGGGGEVRGHAWVIPDLRQEHDFFFRENGQAILASDGLIRTFNPDGSEARRLAVPILSPRQIAEAPNGALYVSEAYGIVAVSPDTGEILWRFQTGKHRFAVGLDNTIYTAGSFGGGLCAIAPDGSLEWWAAAETNITTDDTPLGLLSDGTIIFQVPLGVKAFRPDGTERWTQFIDGMPLGRTLAIGPDDTIYVAAFGPRLLALHPETGATKWSYVFGTGSTPAPPTVGPDGTIYAGNGNAVFILSPAGTLIRTLPVGEYADAPAVVDANGTIYVGASNQGTLAFTPSGTLKWRYPDGGGQIRLSPTGQLFVRGGIQYWDTVRVVQADGGQDPRTWSSLEGGADGGFRPHTARSTPPRLQGWMTSQKVEPGTPFSLRMRPAGAGPTSYAWSKDGTAISGAIAPHLRIDGAVAADGGSYTLTATNVAGTATSPVATVAVEAATPGERLWQTPILWNNSTIAIARDGTTYVAGRLRSGSGEPLYVFALDASGNELWRHLIDYFSYSVGRFVVADQGGVFAVVGTRGLMSLSSAGGIRWINHQTLVDSILHTGLTQDGDLLLTGTSVTSYAMIACFSGQTGQLRWSHGSTSHSSMGIAAPKVAPDGTILFGLGNTLRAYSPSGTLLWEQTGVGLVQGFTNAQSIYALKSGGGLTVGMRTDGTGGVDFPGVSGSDILRRPDGGFFSSYGLWMPSGERVLSLITQLPALAVDSQNNAFMQMGEGVRGYTQHGAEFFTLASGPGSLTLSRDGGWIGGGPISRFKAHAPVASEPWALAQGDPGRTGRLAAADYPVPRIMSRSTTSAGPVGGRLVLDADITSASPLTFTWWKDDLAIPGASRDSLVLEPLTEADAGVYRLVVTTPEGWTTSITWTVTVAPASARAGYYYGQSGDLVAMARITPSDTFDLVASEPSSGGFVLRDITLAASGDTSVVVREGSPSGPATIAVGGGSVVVTLAGGRTLPLTWTGAQHARSPRPDVYRGGVLRRAHGRLDMIVDAAGHWIWRLTYAAETWSGTAATPTTDATVTTGPLTAQFRADGTFVATITLPDGSTGNVFATAHGLGLRSRLANISTRGHVAPDREPMIAGFVISGAEDQRLLLRAIGPSLARFGVDTAADAVRIDLFRGTQLIESNQFWWSHADPEGLRKAMQDVSAFLLPGYSLDSALFSPLRPAAYTVHVSPAGDRGGIALVEVYDSGTELASLRSTQAVNMSTRGFAGSAEKSLIVGFVISEPVPKRVLIRGVGPGLARYLDTYSRDPDLRVHDTSGNVLVTNASWDADGAGPALREAFAQAYAFNLADGSLDAAVAVYLPPGAYTAVITSETAQEGTALVEVYELEW